MEGLLRCLLHHARHVQALHAAYLAIPRGHQARRHALVQAEVDEHLIHGVGDLAG